MAMGKRCHYCHFWHEIQHSEALGEKFLAAMHCSPIINIYELRDQNAGQGDGTNTPMLLNPQKV